MTKKERKLLRRFDKRLARIEKMMLVKPVDIQEAKKWLNCPDFRIKASDLVRGVERSNVCKRIV